MMLYNRSIAADNAAAYVVAQIAGGILAATSYTMLKSRV
jgi:glycerol uptake facilitator-like aquaporin